ncbi:Hypothetical_protein [Hexamita inflata]|uniref:Hypothetical_protein n=1 Tax=Hexamita inflata TaxID=28002 RepID=A0AA86NPK3_9EUKA|nr:Hypothetical protein HINF_LOCUS10070 [Hexamita inflata]
MSLHCNFYITISFPQQLNNSTIVAYLNLAYSLYGANQTLCYTSQSQLFLKSDSVNTIAQRYSQTVINQEAAYVFTYLRSLNVLLIVHNVQEYLFQLNQAISSFLDFQ